MTDILKSFSTLQSELDVAKTTLKGVDENIKRLIGRDPSELPTRPPVKRNNSNQIEDRGRPRALVNQNDERRFKNSRMRMFVQENQEPPIKKRATGISVFKRLSDRPIPDDSQSKQHKGMISKVIVTPKEVPSRQERLDAQSKDATSVARNKRMFGALMGTLQKFQQEETKLKQKEDKRAQLEKKIEEHEIKEKEEIKKERQELFFNRKKKQAEIKMIELKMIRMKEYGAWEESQKRRMNFIYTKTKPQIHFLPRKLKDVHKTLLETSRTEIQTLIDKKREQVQEELMHIEERGKRIFEPRKLHQESKGQDNEEQDHENGIEDEDVTMENLHHQETEQENIENNNTPITAQTENSEGHCEMEVGHNDSQESESLGHSEQVDIPPEISSELNKEILTKSDEQISDRNELNVNTFLTSNSTDYTQQAEATCSTNFNQIGYRNNIVIVDVIANPDE